MRMGRVADFARAQAIEVAAGEVFRDVGLGFVADMPPPGVDVLAGFAAGGRFWVAEEERTWAYLLAEVVDGCAHIAQVTVHPAQRGRRLGSSLVDHLDGWAAARGLAALTLTTYRDVPWNGPYYERIGFRVIEPTPGLAAVVADEARIGLDPDARVCMRRELS